MDVGKLIERIKSILLAPKKEWPVIAGEPATIKGLYTNYIMILAAIPAVFGFLKGSLVGHSMFGVTVTTPILAGIVGMIVGYVLSLVMLYVVALIINALAPSFGGQKNQVQALKVAGYAWTAAWIASIATIIPWLGWLVVLAGAIYSVYLLYLGLPHTMKCPPEKAAGYTAVSVIIVIVLSLIMGMVIAGVTAMSGLTGAALTGNNSADNANVTFDEDSQLGKLAAMGERMQRAGEQAEAEAARKSGSTARGDRQSSGEQASNDDDPAQAMAAMMGAVMGDKDGKIAKSLTPDQLKSFLPESLGDMQRESLSASRESAMGMEVTEASADYANADGSQRVSINLTDMPATGGLMAMADAFGGKSESESQNRSGYEKNYVRDGHRIHEKWNKNSNRGEYSITVADRFSVEADGEVQSMDQLKGIVGSIDLVRLASLKHETE